MADGAGHDNTRGAKAEAYKRQAENARRTIFSITPVDQRHAVPPKPTFDFGVTVAPQSDPALCPVYDVRPHWLTGRRYVYYCTLPRGHPGACSLL